MLEKKQNEKKVLFELQEIGDRVCVLNGYKRSQALTYIVGRDLYSEGVTYIVGRDFYSGGVTYIVGRDLYCGA